jgi:hypothetical protein
MSLDGFVIDQDRPAPSAGFVAFVAFVAFVVAASGKLDTGSAVLLAQAAIHPAAHDDDAELSVTVLGEFDESRLNHVVGIGIPPVHLGDSPAAGQLRGRSRQSLVNGNPTIHKRRRDGSVAPPGPS